MDRQILDDIFLFVSIIVGMGCFTGIIMTLPQAPRPSRCVGRRLDRSAGRDRRPSQPSRHGHRHGGGRGRADLRGPAVHGEGAGRAMRRSRRSRTKPRRIDHAALSPIRRARLAQPRCRRSEDLDFPPREAEHALRLGILQGDREHGQHARRRHPASFGRRERSTSRTRVPTRTTPFRSCRAASKAIRRRAPWIFARSRRRPKSSG